MRFFGSFSPREESGAEKRESWLLPEETIKAYLGELAHLQSKLHLWATIEKEMRLAEDGVDYFQVNLDPHERCLGQRCKWVG